MDESEAVRRAALDVAAAIERRDVSTVAGALAPGFVHRSPGAPPVDAETFLKGIAEIPGEIVFVRLVDLDIDLSETGALATGIQHARVRIDGKDIDDRRAFADWFIAHDGKWKIRVAVDLPFESPASAE
jgi:ketosteroid isomerase-like protein